MTCDADLYKKKKREKVVKNTGESLSKLPYSESRTMVAHVSRPTLSNTCYPTVESSASPSSSVQEVMCKKSLPLSPPQLF